MGAVMNIEFTRRAGRSHLPAEWNSQEATRWKRLGVLMGYRENDREARARLSAFFQSFEELGWKEGRNIRLEYRWAAASPDQIRSSASELAQWSPDAILAATTPVVRALLAVT